MLRTLYYFGKHQGGAEALAITHQGSDFTQRHRLANLRAGPSFRDRADILDDVFLFQTAKFTVKLVVHSAIHNIIRNGDSITHVG
jgi:hypothetical protein